MNKYKYLNNIEDHLEDILKLDKNFFKDEYLWEIDYQKSIYQKNPNTFVSVTYNNELIGYINFLVITKKTYNKMKNNNYTIDSFSLEDILPFKKGNNYITINSIVIKKEHQNGIVIKMLINGLIEVLNNENNKGNTIYGINSIAVSQDGRKFLNNLNFKKYKELDDGNILYCLEKEKIKYLLEYKIPI